MFDFSSDGIFIINEKGKILFVNKELSDMLKFTKEELVGANIQQLYASSISLFSTNCEIQLKKSDGKIIDCVEFTGPIESGDGIGIYYKIVQDVNSNKNDEGKLVLASREINYLIAQERDTVSLLKQACRSFSRLKESLEVWIGLFNRGNMEIIEAVGKHNESELNSMAKSGDILCLRAVENNNKKIGTVPIDYFCKNCSLNGNKSNKLVVPIEHENELLGVLWFHSNTESDIFTNKEQEIINELAGDLALALRIIEMERKRDEALDRVRDNMEYFEYLADRLRNPLAIIRGFLDVKSDVGPERTLREISYQVDRINGTLDNLRKKEEETFNLER